MMGKVVYFDNAATTYPKPEVVYDFMDKYYREFGVNVSRGQYRMASQAKHLVEETRALIKELFHCTNKEVVFTHSATESLNIILRGIENVEGYKIYLSPFEHNAVIRTINHLEYLYDLEVFELSVDKSTISYDIEGIKAQFIDNPPDLVIMSHASNVCGVIAPIEEICKLSKKYQAINVIDMSQTAGLVETDLSSDIYDYAVFAGHKTLYGPLGVAGFICKKDASIEPLIYGGTGVDSANPSLPNTIPEKFEVGSQNIMAIAGLNAALKWMRDVGIDEIHNREHENYQRLIEILQQYDNIKIIGQSELEDTVGVVSCVFDYYSSDDIGKILNDNNIAARTGLHCAPNAHRFLGTFPAGTVRFSVGFFTSESEFSQLKAILNMIDSEG